MNLTLKEIRTDGGTQPRSWINPDIVTEYADDMTEGAQFPPVTVFYDGSDYWLADGFHRVAAAKKIDMITIAADVKQGSQRDAVLFSVGVNATHGFRRRNSDKRRAVEVLLRDSEWAGWSDSEIGRKCVVHHSTVARIRAELSLAKSASERTYITKHGTQAKMHTANIGKRKQQQQSAQEEPVYEEPIEEDEIDHDYLDENTTVDYAIDHITDYAESILSEIADPTHRHAVVNAMIKHFRQLAIEFERQSIGA